MPKYVIERILPGAGKLSEKELHAIDSVNEVKAIIDPVTGDDR